MDEVDRIIIRTLRNLICDVEEDQTSLSQFSTELVIEGAVACLKAINPSLELSPKLPPSLTARFKLGAAIAQACVDLGYKGEIGYQTFLYSSELELRKLFIFLIEKLPKEPEVIEQTSQSSLERKIQEIRLKIAEEVSIPWMPYHAYSQGLYWSGDSFSRQNYPCGSEFVAESIRWPSHDAIPSVTNLVKQPFHLVPSLLEMNALQLLRQTYKKPVPVPKIVSVPFRTSRFAVTSQIHGKEQTAQVKKAMLKPVLPTKPAHLRASQSEAQVEPQRDYEEREIEALQAEIQSLKLKSEELHQSRIQVDSRLDEVNSKMSKEDAFLKERLTSSEKEEKIYGLLSDGLEHVTRLSNHVEKLRQKISSLPKQWDEVRLPLEERLHELRSHGGNQRKEVSQMEDTRRKLERVLEEINIKEALYTKLEIECQSLEEEVPRLFYTRRIMEIIQNVQKQNEEIHRMLNDLCVLQREINQSVGKLDRTFTVADELLFRSAKRDAWNKKAYKLLAQLHASFEDITRAVEESGQLNREVLDLEEQLACEQSKHLAVSLQRIGQDLHLIREENTQLIAQLKALRQQ